MAPTVFQRKFTGTGGISVVHRQPDSHFEHQKAAEAMESCPVGAIQFSPALVGA